MLIIMMAAVYWFLKFLYIPFNGHYIVKEFVTILSCNYAKIPTNLSHSRNAAL